MTMSMPATPLAALCLAMLLAGALLPAQAPAPSGPVRAGAGLTVLVAFPRE